MAGALILVSPLAPPLIGLSTTGRSRTVDRLVNALQVAIELSAPVLCVLWLVVQTSGMVLICHLANAPINLNLFGSSLS